MSWTSTDILGSDLTKDFHYEILKIVCGEQNASSYITNDAIAIAVLTNENKHRFLDNLGGIYDMCKSLNKLEETWQMQVLANFMVNNQYYCSSSVYRESAKVLWNNFNYEFEHVDLFGWQSNFDKTVRRNKLKDLYDAFGIIRWAGIESNTSHSPFGTLNTPRATYNPYATIATIAPAGVITSTPVSIPATYAPPPPSALPAHENISVRTNSGSIQCSVLNVIQDWVKFTVDNKQWSYRTIRTDRGYILQTRWGGQGTSTSRLRLTSKIFTRIYSMNTALHTILRRKQNSGYVRVNVTF